MEIHRDSLTEFLLYLNECDGDAFLRLTNIRDRRSHNAGLLTILKTSREESMEIWKRLLYNKPSKISL